MAKYDGMSELEIKFYTIVYYLRRPGIEFDVKYRVNFEEIKAMLDAYDIVGWDREKKQIIRKV